VVLAALPAHPIRPGNDDGPQFDFRAEATSGWRLP